MQRFSSARTTSQTEDLTDRCLIHRVTTGDTDAFATLYQRYVPRLRAYLTTQLEPSAIVDDVCQDVLMVIWRRAADLYPTTRVSSWIFGIARRQARTAWARSMTKPVIERPEIEIESDLTDPESLFIRHERDRTVAQVLATLPPPQRTVLYLAYYQEASYKDIASRLGCSVSMVKTRLRQAGSPASSRPDDSTARHLSRQTLCCWPLLPFCV
jgi:RNA polymerase sigma-70 factor (ECF subfamily)